MLHVATCQLIWLWLCGQTSWCSAVRAPTNPPTHTRTHARTQARTHVPLNAHLYLPFGFHAWEKKFRSTAGIMFMENIFDIFFTLGHMHPPEASGGCFDLEFNTCNEFIIMFCQNVYSLGYFGHIWGVKWKPEKDAWMFMQKCGFFCFCLKSYHS